MTAGAVRVQAPVARSAVKQRGPAVCRARGGAGRLGHRAGGAAAVSTEMPKKQGPLRNGPQWSWR